MAEIDNVTVRADAVITDEYYRVTMGAVMAANECMDMLAAENAKLRELVTDMCEWAYIDSYCDLRQEFADRMRELGLEASE